MTRQGTREVVRRRVDPTARYGLRVTLLALALALVTVPFGLLLDSVLRDGPLTRYDTAAANSLHAWVRDKPAVIDAFQALSFVGSATWCYPALAVLALLCWWRGRHRLVGFVVVTPVLSSLINNVVKVLVDRDRPALDEPIATAFGRSFPSGHTMNATVSYGVLLLVVLPVISRRWRAPLAALALLVVVGVGFSRLALGVHYLTDVIGGFVLGLAWLLVSTSALAIWRREEGAPPPAAGEPDGGPVAADITGGRDVSGPSEAGPQRARSER